VRLTLRHLARGVAATSQHPLDFLSRHRRNGAAATRRRRGRCVGWRCLPQLCCLHVIRPAGHRSLFLCRSTLCMPALALHEGVLRCLPTRKACEKARHKARRLSRADEAVPAPCSPSLSSPAFASVCPASGILILPWHLRLPASRLPSHSSPLHPIEHGPVPTVAGLSEDFGLGTVRLTGELSSVRAPRLSSLSCRWRRS
jgi:hypothetical protein